MLYQVWRDDPICWMCPFVPGALCSAGTVPLQVGIRIVILAVCNRRLAAATARDSQ